MPELPEVETVARQLNESLAGKKISALEILNSGSFQGDSRLIVGKVVQKIGRKAKTITIKFDDNLYVLIHLKMTGQLILVSEKGRVAGGHPSHDFHSALPNTHTRVLIDFDDDSVLYFNDMRKFGWIKVVDKDGYNKYFEKFGPDAVPKIDLDYFLQRASRMNKSSIKKFILDQSVVAGVGNIYADEALFESRIAPSRLVGSLNQKEWENLISEISKKLIFAIEKGGTTDSDYVNAYGQKGGMQDYLNVYHKTGELCPNGCGGTITRTTVAGRGTHYCPKCQKDLV